jgi:hypothetical protein
MSPSQRNSASARLKNYGSVTNAVKAMEHNRGTPGAKKRECDIGPIEVESGESGIREKRIKSSPELDLLFAVSMERSSSSGPESGAPSALCYRVIY